MATFYDKQFLGPKQVKTQQQQKKKANIFFLSDMGFEYVTLGTPFKCVNLSATMTTDTDE